MNMSEGVLKKEKRVPYELHVGSEFKTFDDFMRCISLREAKLGERWVKGPGGKTIDAVNQNVKNPKGLYKQSFKYQYINFKCIHGGVFKSTAKIRNTKSMRTGCQAHIQISARRKRDALVVTKMIKEHNHEITPGLYGQYAVDRKPTDQELSEVLNLKRLGVTTNRIRKYMLQVYGKAFTRIDIGNMRSKPEDKPEMDQGLTIPARIMKEDDIIDEGENVDSVLEDINANDIQIEDRGSRTHNQRQLSKIQKVRFASRLAEDLVNVMVSCSENIFEKRCEVLRSLMVSWRSEARSTFNEAFNKLKHQIALQNMAVDNEVYERDDDQYSSEMHPQDTEMLSQDTEMTPQNDQIKSRNLEMPSHDTEMPPQNVEMPSQDIEVPSRDLLMPFQKSDVLNKESVVPSKQSEVIKQQSKELNPEEQIIKALVENSNDLVPVQEGIPEDIVSHSNSSQLAMSSVVKKEPIYKLELLNQNCESKDPVNSDIVVQVQKSTPKFTVSGSKSSQRSLLPVVKKEPFDDKFKLNECSEIIVIVKGNSQKLGGPPSQKIIYCKAKSSNNRIESAKEQSNTPQGSDNSKGDHCYHKDVTHDSDNVSDKQKALNKPNQTSIIRTRSRSAERLKVKIGKKGCDASDKKFGKIKYTYHT